MTSRAPPFLVSHYENRIRNRARTRAQRKLSQSVSELPLIERSDFVEDFAYANSKEAEVERHFDQQPIRRRLSAAELTFLEQEAKDRENEQSSRTKEEDERDEDYDNRPVVLRKRRFTRKQRKSVSIEPETGLILAVGAAVNGRYSSSDENDERQHEKSNKRSANLKSNDLRNSNIEKPNSEVDQPRAKHIATAKRAPRGPSARRATRHLRSKFANSTGDLAVMDNQSSIQAQTRSLSVRNLNGEQFDFANQDAVTKWTSQILAEISSLPSSCLDLTKPQPTVTVTRESPFTSLRRPAPTPLTVYNPMTCSLSSAYHSSIPWMAPTSGDRMTTSQIVFHTDSLIEDLATSIHSSTSELTTRDRENSINASTIVASSSEATPKAQSLEDLKECETKENFVLSLASEEKSQQSESSTFLSTRDGSSITPPASQANGNLSTTVFTRQPQPPLSSSPSTWLAPANLPPPLPIPAKRTLSIELMKEANKPRTTAQQLEGVKKASKEDETMKELVQSEQNNDVRLRKIDPLEEVDERLRKSIARMTQSVYGDTSSRQVSGRLSLMNLNERAPSERDISMRDESEMSLNRWKKKAECRARMGEAGGRTSSILTAADEQSQVGVEKSVNVESDLAEIGQGNVGSIVAALIKSIEENRYKAADTPTLLNIEQETGTQTSPFSISRSSSFDWIIEPTEGRLRDIQTPSEPTKGELLKRDRNDWSSENDEADREVAAMTEKSRAGEKIKENEKEKLFRKMDESLALLLECSETAQNGNLKANSAHSSLTREPVDWTGSGSVNHSSANEQQDVLSPPVPPRSFRNIQPPPRLKTIDSIYDNMPGRRKLKIDDELGSYTSSPSTEHSNRSTNLLAKESPYAENVDSSDGIAVLSQTSQTAGVLPSLPLAQVDAHLTSKIKDAENDALEACRWLRQAGFPQYVKQYEEGNFPIDLHSANKDHAFLGTDSLRALYRRLDTLNRCAIMKIDNVIMRRRNDFDVFGFDDEDNVALSSNWQYQRQSHTWSRIGNESMYGAPGRLVSTKPNWQIDKHTVSPYDKRADGRTERYEEGKMDNINGSNGYASVPSAQQSAAAAAAAAAQNKLSRSQSERIKERARAIMKKMDLRSSSRRRASRARDATNPLVIGDPVLLSFDSCTNSSNPSIPRPSDLSVRSRPMGPSERQSRSKSARRQGVVLLSPTRPSNDSPPPTYPYSPNPSHSHPHRVPIKRDRSVPPPTSYHTRAHSHSHPRRDYLPPSPPLPHGYYAQPIVGNGSGSGSGRYSGEESPYSNHHGHSRELPQSIERYRFDPRTLLERHNVQQGGSLPRWVPRHPSTGSSTTSDLRGPIRTSPYCYQTPSSMSSSTSHSLNHSPSVSHPQYPSSVASSTNSSPYYSPYQIYPHSHRQNGSPPPQTLERSRNLIIQDDGYYVHDVSSDSSLLRNAASESPSTSHASNGDGSHLKVDTHGNKSQGSLTDDEQLGGATFVQSRRDSGVGSSLSRSPSGPSSLRIRQSIFPSTSSSLKSSTHQLLYRSPPHLASSSAALSYSLNSSAASDDSFFSDIQLAHCIDSLSVIDVVRIRKLAYLRVTGILERCMGVGALRDVDLNCEQTRQNGAVHAAGNWTHKLMQRIKQIDGKNKESGENAVFGVSLDVAYKRWGFCLPRPVLEVIAFLRLMAPDTVGLFRKNGVKSRIAELRELCERGEDAFTEDHKLHSSQVHDVADMLKQYLRELPEPLMTCRLSEVFINIFMHVPENERFNALQHAVLLLPDENREALQTLLFFLHDVAKYSQVNNMPPQNLAVCFAPSLFHMTASRLDKVSGSRRHKTIGAAGMPTEKEMRETRAAQLCLTQMIENPRLLFTLPEGAIEERSQEEDIPPLKDLGLKNARDYLIDKVLGMVKDHDERWKNWTSEGNHEGIEISSKKNLDEHPLKTWRVWVDVAAPPKEVMARILKERVVWDTSVINWRHVEMVHAPDTDIHQYVLNDTVGHPSRDCHLVRFHRADIQEIRGSCAVAERSVACNDKQLLGGLSAAVLDTRFLITPRSGVSRVTYIARVDLRGRSTAWYNRTYGALMARQMGRLRDSFAPHSSPSDGPETKV